MMIRFLPDTPPRRDRGKIVEGNRPGSDVLTGSLTKLSAKGGEARLEAPVPAFSNLKMNPIDAGRQRVPGSLHAKVTGTAPETTRVVGVRFTSMSPDIGVFLRGVLKDGLST
jgi:hypothetical protein